MADSCAQYVSADDIKATKESILHIEHVVTSKDANGNPALVVTDPIRGGNYTNSTLDGLQHLYEQAISQAGYITLKSFQLGAPLPNNELTLPNQVLQDETDGEYYRWDGSFPKAVAAGSTPATTGGVGLGAWVSVGDASAREWVSENFQSLHFKKSPGSFTTGGSAIYNQSALLNVADGMYYMPKTGEITAPAGSSPDNSWICVGLMSQYELGDLRNFKGAGDGIAVDTQAFILAVAYANHLKQRVLVPGGYTFVCDKMKFTGISSVTIEGSGCIKMIGGRSGAFYYADGAQMTFINSYDMKFIGVEFDGNRSGSPLYTGANHGIQFGTGDGDYRSNNGGPVKTNRNILISGCYFHDQGSYSTSIDKFGDGVVLFGCDGVVIEKCKFVDMGRWGVSASDIFNLIVVNNYFNSSKEGTVALGFVDIENESTDPINGTYSKNIIISGNNIFGYGQILVGGGSNSENYQGALHYLHNVAITDNTIILDGGAHNNPGYLTNLIMIGVAPFCHVKPTNGVVENIGFIFSGNTLINKIPSLCVGMGILQQGIGENNLVKNISFIGNSITGFNKGILSSGDVDLNGYTLRNLIIGHNVIDCTEQENSIGIRVSSRNLVGFKIDGNIIRDTKSRGISVEDGRDLGATATYGEISNNQISAAQGTNVVAYLYRAALFNNTLNSSSTALDATVTNMDRDYGNSWNHIMRTINGFTVNSMSQVTQDAIDIGSQTRYGYTVQLVPPFNLEGAQSSAMVTVPGLARAFITNLSSSTVTKASDVWHLTVEKK